MILPKLSCGKLLVKQPQPIINYVLDTTDKLVIGDIAYKVMEWIQLCKQQMSNITSTLRMLGVEVIIALVTQLRVLGMKTNELQ